MLNFPKLYLENTDNLLEDYIRTASHFKLASTEFHSLPEANILIGKVKYFTIYFNLISDKYFIISAT